MRCHRMLLLNASMKISAVWALLTLPLWAGESLRINGSQTATNTSVAAQGINAPCRMEFQLSFTSSPKDGHPANINACAIIVQYNTGFLTIHDDNARWGCCFNISLANFTSNWLIVRYQQIPSGSGGTFTWEAWDINGVLQVSHTETYAGTSGSNSNGASVGSTGNQNSSWGFFRLYTTTVPLGSAEPTFADNGNLLEWKFNTSLADASGRGYTATSNGGTPAKSCGSTPCYEATSGQSLVTAVIKATPAAAWGNPPSWRAGTNVGLDCSGSISMADSGGTPSCFWQISGPSRPVWSPSQTAVRPTLTGIVFGNYHVQLVATSSSGSATATADIGAVAQDSNGVVVNADPNVDMVFGPMIALGKNPWGWADERQYAMIALQTAYLSSRDYNPPPFVKKAQGTIAYKFGGNLNCTTLSSGITATTLSIRVTNASCLSLSTLPGTPTDIIVGTELIRICSTSATSGAATLTACYDGRGAARGSFSYNGGLTTQVAAQSWSSGTGVGDEMTTGTNTLFATDAARPVCPAGVPGPPGRVVYSTGTVTLIGNSAVISGSGTTWNAGNGVVAGNMVRIQATHAGGTAFVTWAVINSVDSTSQITLSRAMPSDVDAGPFSYKITGPLYFSSEATIPGTSSVTNVAQDIQICESETRLSTQIYFEGGAIFGTSISGVQYSYKLSLGATSFTFQPNYYGTGLAARSLYYRSGYGPAKTLADNIDEYWINDPEVCAGYCLNATTGIRMAGGVIGALADKVTNKNTILSWDHFRNFGTNAARMASSRDCAYSDTRDTGGMEAVVALLALFDTAQQATWNAILYGNSDSFYVWDQACKGANNSWANSLYFNPSTTVTLTSGSTAVVAISGIFSNSVTGNNGCSGVASGTATATAGSDILTRISGTYSAGAYQIAITGTRLGSSYTLITDYRNDNTNHLTLGGKWPADADSGTVSWTTVAYPFNVTAFAIDSSDSSALAHNFICTYVDPTHITLNRPWPLESGTTRHISSSNLEGKGQQPFMLGGSKSLALQWAALNSNPTIASAFNTELQQAAGWMFTTGFDPYTLGPYYGRIFNACEPVIVPSTNFPAYLRQSGCADGISLDGIIASRELTAESSTALRAYYASQGNSAAAKLWADTQYGALWSRTGFDTGGVYADNTSAGNNIGASNLTDNYLGSFKWPGFFFGMGMVHQWPAARLGGVAPGLPRTLSVTCNISGVINATKCRVTLTKPDGSTVTNTCTSSPCAVTADARQGDHLLKVDYVSASNAVLNPGDAAPVRVP
ncbi:MAG: hypothetical protein JWO19_3364 [Bryobacterales bacterium]|nr:hypothetical protein [Bryobacterales bacterium]